VAVVPQRQDRAVDFMRSCAALVQGSSDRGTTRCKVKPNREFPGERV
jgi:hypothetical protein